MLPEAEQIAMYDTAGNMPLAWVGSAESLLAAASVLRAARDAACTVPLKVGDPVPAVWMSHPCELMLRGFAFECFFKALWVKSGRKLALRGKFQRIPGAGQHDLQQLAQKVDFACTPHETDVLKRLSLFTTSIGRYPIASHWEKTRIQATHGGGHSSPTYWSFPADDQACEAMVHRLNAQLNK